MTKRKTKAQRLVEAVGGKGEAHHYGAHELLLDLLAYVGEAATGGDDPRAILATVAHDLAGYRNERDEDWWCPRTKDHRLRG